MALCQRGRYFPAVVRPALAFAGFSEAARASILLNLPPRSRFLTGLALGCSAVRLTFAVYQLHHFEALLVTLCRT